MQTVSDAHGCGHILMRLLYNFVSGGRRRSGRVQRSCVHLPDSPSPDRLFLSIQALVASGPPTYSASEKSSTASGIPSMGHIQSP